MADCFAAELTLRSAVMAAELTACSGHDELVGDVLIGGLIRHIGCTGFAHEEAHLYGAGDDVALRQTMAAVDFAQPEDAMRRIQEGVAPDASPEGRAQAIEAF